MGPHFDVNRCYFGPIRNLYYNGEDHIVLSRAVKHGFKGRNQDFSHPYSIYLVLAPLREVHI